MKNIIKLIVDTKVYFIDLNEIACILPIDADNSGAGFTIMFRNNFSIHIYLSNCYRMYERLESYRNRIIAYWVGDGQFNIIE